MNATAELRRARLADAAAIAALHVASWKATYAGELPDTFFRRLDVRERTRVWESRLGAADYHVEVMAADTNVLAFCGSGPAHDADDDPRTTWQIHNLHVSPALKRGGLGGRLFDSAVALGRAHEAAQLTLWVAESNQPARRFYEKKGMQPDGARQRYEFERDAALATVRYRMDLK